MGSGLFFGKVAIKQHLLQGSGGLGSEIADLRKDVSDTLKNVAGLALDEFINPAAAGAADLEAATATTVAARTVVLLAGGLAKLAAFPRNVTFTTAGVTPANAPANAVITGTYRGKLQTETVVIAQTAAVATGVKPFSTITSIVYAVGDGTAATVSVGVGLGLGLSEKPKALQTLFWIPQEVVDAGVVTTGVVTAEGLYTPATAPNGTHDYSIAYLFDGTL